MVVIVKNFYLDYHFFHKRRLLWGERREGMKIGIFGEIFKTLLGSRGREVSQKLWKIRRYFLWMIPKEIYEISCFSWVFKSQLAMTRDVVIYMKERGFEHPQIFWVFFFLKNGWPNFCISQKVKRPRPTQPLSRLHLLLKSSKDTLKIFAYFVT